MLGPRQFPVCTNANRTQARLGGLFSHIFHADGGHVTCLRPGQRSCRSGTAARTYKVNTGEENKERGVETPEQDVKDLRAG